MNVLFLSRLNGIGGGETSLINLIKGLKNGQHNLYVISAQHSKFTEAVQQFGEVAVLPYWLPGEKSRWLLAGRSALQLYLFLKRKSINVVHANDPLSAVIAAIPAKCLNIPVVMTSHGDWDTNRFRNALYNCLLTKIVCVSDFVRKSYSRAKNIREDLLTTVYLGVDTARFRPGLGVDHLQEEFGIRKGDRIVSVFGRFQSVKGHRYFLEAAEIIARQRRDVKFLVVGSCQFDSREEKINFDQFRKAIENSDVLRQRVIMPGFRSDIPELMNLSDVVVCPSLSETFGMAIAEAMACGKVVVSTDRGGPSEIIEDGVSGALVPVADSSKIADRVMFYLENEGSYETVALNAQKRVLEKFSLERYAREVAGVYQNIQWSSQ